jgi:hypothetical protein
MGRGAGSGSCTSLRRRGGGGSAWGSRCHLASDGGGPERAARDREGAARAGRAKSWLLGWLWNWPEMNSVVFSFTQFF